MTPKTQRPRPAVRLTSAVDGREHRVDDADRSGRARAACGHVVVPVSLATPPGPPCVVCATAE